MKFTILGTTGFIGSAVTNYLKSNEIECITPDIRKEIPKGNLGNVIYAIGVSNFLERPFDTVEAHVCELHKILTQTNFESFLYVSTGRFYYGASSTNEKDSLLVNSTDKNQLYNISKIMGESLCYASNNENVRIVRPSNVTGINSPPNLFIPSIINDAIKNKKIILQSSLDSERDYLYIDDFIKIILEISMKGKEKIYNIAYGKNIKNKEIVNEISRITGCQIEVKPNAINYSAPIISIEKIKKEFDFTPVSIIPKLKTIIEHY